MEINLTNSGFLAKFRNFFQFQKIVKKKKKNKKNRGWSQWITLDFSLLCSTIFYFILPPLYFILFYSTPPMLTMWPCKWNCDEEKWNMLSNGGWKTLAFSAAPSNFDFGAVFATLVFPWDAVLLCHLSLSLCVRDSSFFCSLARRQPGGSSRAMGLSFQGKGTRPGSCFSFSFLVEFWGFCCETLMDVRCRKTDSFLSFFFFGRILVRPGWCFLICC